MLRTERIDAALRDRTWSLPARAEPRHWNVFFLRAGAASLEDAYGRAWLDPAMVFLAPADEKRTLFVRAGAEGVLVTFDQRNASAAPGSGLDGPAITRLMDSRNLVRLPKDAGAVQEVEFALGLLNTENPTRQLGHDTLIEAALKILFVSLLRNLPDLSTARPPQGQGSRVIHRFRQLLESNFRQRWTVARYAKALGIDPDRLHDICTRKLGRAPSDLIQDRANYEARLLLANSNATTAEISAQLGYKDPSHFSKNFSRRNRVSPRTYRRRLLDAAEAERLAVIDYSDWP